MSSINSLDDRLIGSYFITYVFPKRTELFKLSPTSSTDNLKLFECTGASKDDLISKKVTLTVVCER